MKAPDFGRRAEILVSRSLEQFFGDQLASGFGRELFRTIRRRLRARGLEDVDHAEEVLAEALAQSLAYLRRHGDSGIRNPRAWLYGIARNEIRRYVQGARNPRFQPLQSIIEGEMELPDSGDVTDERVLDVVRRAITILPPRQRELICFDLVEGLSMQEIQSRMKIASNAYFRKLKSVAYAALRDAIRSLITEGSP